MVVRWFAELWIGPLALCRAYRDFSVKKVPCYDGTVC